MKKVKFCMLGSALILGSTPIVTVGTNAYANEGTPEQQTSLGDIEDETNPIYDSKTSNDNLPENVTLVYIEEGSIVTVYEEGTTQKNRIARATAYRWSGWEYTNLAISTGVLAGAINTGLSVGVGFVARTIVAVGGLLTASGWTKLGNAPGAAVAKQWDKNGNGWVGFYYQRGYDAAG
ncbi:hypothetical protein [Enterococcus faecalis]|uniref:hypothetical protein n=1 Tax=Enterococcus faecalis TaxID=1351 RepID=UPI001F59A9E0|nr:hypothetical protein [Enterococcus faecalis]